MSKNNTGNGKKPREWPSLAEWIRTCANKPIDPSPNWRSPMFPFTRMCKGHPDLCDLDPVEAADVIEECLGMNPDDSEDGWRGLPGGLESKDPRAEFIATWPQVRMPEGLGSLELASAAAERLPLVPLRKYSKGYSRFINVAGHLQQLRPTQTIRLPLRKMAELFGCDETTISNYRKFAKDEGILVEIAPHDVARRKATEFRFVKELFDWETGKQIQDARKSIQKGQGSKEHQNEEKYQKLQIKTEPNKNDQVVADIPRQFKAEHIAPTKKMPETFQRMTDGDLERRRQLLKRQAEEIEERRRS